MNSYIKNSIRNTDIHFEICLNSKALDSKDTCNTPVGKQMHYRL